MSVKPSILKTNGSRNETPPHAPPQAALNLSQQPFSNNPAGPRRPRKGAAVSLRVFDLSRGKVEIYGSLFLNDRKKGIWHTSVCVFSKEYFYMSTICVCLKGFGWPGEELLTDEIQMGCTDATEEELEAYLHLQHGLFTPDRYDVFVHNCNHFSQSVLRFLDIATLPDRVLDTVLGKIVRPFVDASVNKLKAELRRTAAPSELEGEVFFYGGAHPAVPNWDAADRKKLLKKAARRQQQLRRDERRTRKSASPASDVFLGGSLQHRAGPRSRSQTRAAAAARDIAGATTLAASTGFDFQLPSYLADAWQGRKETVSASSSPQPHRRCSSRSVRSCIARTSSIQGSGGGCSNLATMDAFADRLREEKAAEWSAFLAKELEQKASSC
ncbi:hypothetical protein cyc_05486 [Cyclospora cayetanensis]|uniref:PPPDE domain-containing protein n=1 Tax=Cyclospora cayetanensis TaxID=88456 RepID=A0A1D3CZ03_9EIME|nr:hypothetical protein cyc_05486 [Cyclospora cayetanensis]